MTPAVRSFLWKFAELVVSLRRDLRSATTRKLTPSLMFLKRSVTSTHRRPAASRPSSPPPWSPRRSVPLSPRRPATSSSPARGRRPSPLSRSGVLTTASLHPTRPTTTPTHAPLLWDRTDDLLPSIAVATALYIYYLLPLLKTCKLPSDVLFISPYYHPIKSIYECIPFCVTIAI